MYEFRWNQWNVDKCHKHNIVPQEATATAETIMKKQPLDPRLPGRYGKMTARELDAEVARFDREIPESEMKPLTAAQRAAHRRARGRGGRPKTGEGARRVLITVERGLLRRADFYARSNGISRSELIAEGLKSILGSAA